MDTTEIITDFLFHSWTLFFIGLVTTVYLYLTWHFDYWKKQRVKCDKPFPIFGTMSNPFGKEPFDVQDAKMYKKYGRVYGIFEGRRPSLHIAEVDMLKTVFVKDFNTFRNRRGFPLSEKDTIVKKFLPFMYDDDWKNLRNILTPAFTTGKMKHMIVLINECAEKMIKQMKPYADNNMPLECKRFISSFSMDVVATCAFGTKLNYIDDPESEFLVHARKFFNNTPKLYFLAYLFPSLIDYVPAIFPRDSIRFFAKLLNEVIKAREKQATPQKDFLQLLLETRKEYEEKKNGIGNDHRDNGTNKTTKFEMTFEYVIAQSMIFLVAGFETTAITVSFAMYSLIMNNEIQEKLIKEIDEILKKYEGVISYESISEMQYLDMVISETMRMYPAVGRLERVCEEDNYNLNGIILKKGMAVSIPVYSIHHDEEYFPNPSVFDPERFSPENRSKINPYTFLPFGVGLRNCIGNRFAITESKIALIWILRNFRMKKCTKTQIPFKRQKYTVMMQLEELNILLEKRNDAQ